MRDRITFKILHDPLLVAVEKKAREDRLFLSKLTSLAAQDNLFHAEFKNGYIVSHLTDDALEAFYDHK